MAVADKPQKLTQKWTGLYRVSQVFNKICLELTAVADPSIQMRTTIHYVTVYKGENTMHHSIKRPDQLVLPCPDTEEDIDFQGVEPATPMGRSIAPTELGLPPMNPCNMEAGRELEFQTTPPETVFRQPVTNGAQIGRPTVHPEDHTLDSTQEFGGPDESR